MAFLDVDLVDSLKPCLTGIWPLLREGCRIYVHECEIFLWSLFSSIQLGGGKTSVRMHPGFVGSGVGLPLAMATAWGSELGYAQKSIGIVPEVTRNLGTAVGHPDHGTEP